MEYVDHVRTHNTMLLYLPPTKPTILADLHTSASLLLGGPISGVSVLVLDNTFLLHI